MSAVRATATVRPAAALTPRRVVIVFSGVTLGMSLAGLDQTIVATALPTIVSDLGGLQHLSWIVTSYLLATTASTPLWGKLGDLYGRKSVFQAAIAIFLVGSLLCGISQTMGQLILFRGLQGLGGGGLIVTAQGIIGDVVSPRKRGRYQGIFGAVFGLMSVIGPLAGGFLVDAISWHWVFFVNLPIGVVALVLTWVTLPPLSGRREHQIDYAGALLIAAATTAFILVTTIGGVQYRWLSPQVLGLIVAVGVLTAGFVQVERRAREPILPLHLFTNAVFTRSATIAFCVGVAMLGPATFIPAFLQVVNGASPTESGLRMLPLMLGIPTLSIISGQIVSRTGRYRMLPLVGTAWMTVGLMLLARMDQSTSYAQSALAMLLLAGLGLIVQVVVIATQNAVDYRDLGAATSGVSFFRAIGAAFGVALFGVILTARLQSSLSRALDAGTLPQDFDPRSIEFSSLWLATLTPQAHAAFVAAYADAMHVVFWSAVPFGALGFACAWFLEERPLRETTRAGDPIEGLAASMAHSSADEIEQALSRLTQRENRRIAYEELASLAGVDLPPAGCWLLYRIDEFSPATLCQLGEQLPISRAALEAQLAWLEQRGLVALSPYEKSDRAIALTAAGQAVFERLVTARKARLERLLAGWAPERHAELEALLLRLARVLVPDTEAGT